MSSDFDTFFGQHYDAIVRSLTAYCGEPSLAADCTQEAFIRAYARWRRISRYDSPPAWVRRVAINRLRDEVRSRDRRHLREDRAHRLNTPQPQTEPHLDPAYQMLATLPERQRLAMALHYIDDLSVADCARVMSISEGAVKSHLNKGRTHLETSLLDRHQEPQP